MYRSLDSAGLVQGYEIKIVQIVFHAFGLQIAWAWLSYYMYKHLKKMCDLTVESYLYNLCLQHSLKSQNFHFQLFHWKRDDWFKLYQTGVEFSSILKKKKKNNNNFTYQPVG